MHKVAYVVYKEQVESGKVVRHAPFICKSRLCCNPEHLLVGTALDNYNDCVLEGKHKGLESFASLSKEQRHDRAIKINSKMSIDQFIERSRKGGKAIGSVNMKRLQNSLTAEQRKENARKGGLSVSPEKRELLRQKNRKYADRIDDVLSLYKDGFSVSSIESKLNVPHSTVRKIITGVY